MTSPKHVAMQDLGSIETGFLLLRDDTPDALYDHLGAAIQRLARLVGNLDGTEASNAALRTRHDELQRAVVRATHALQATIAEPKPDPGEVLSAVRNALNVLQKPGVEHIDL